MDRGEQLKEAIRAQAKQLGFAACGFASADGHDPHGASLMRWLGEGRHGTMEWMEARAHHRVSPRALWPQARSVIALGMSYAPQCDPLELAGQGDVGRVSVYAQGSDYHKIVNKRLKALARWLVEAQGPSARSGQTPSTVSGQAPSTGSGEPVELKVFVDTAPVMEKPLSQAAGIGWQGKHTNLVSREHGSWLFLGIIFTSLEIEPDEPAGDTCGTCTRCLDICPTQAFDGARRIDARKCISYLTIEHEGPIPDEFRRAMGNRIYGCDDCLAVCPWNRFAEAAAANRAFVPREELKAPRLQELLALDDAEFRAMFAGSPIKRIGVKRMIRNCLIAAGNSRDPNLLPAIARHVDHPDAVVAEAARWALGEIQLRRSEAMHIA